MNINAIYVCKLMPLYIIGCIGLQVLLLFCFIYIQVNDNFVLFLKTYLKYECNGISLYLIPFLAFQFPN